MARLDFDGHHRAGALADPQALADYRGDFARVVGLVLHVREDPAGVHAPVFRDRFEGDLAERRDVLRPAGIGAADRLPFLHSAHPPADPPQLAVHLFGGHSICEVAHPQDRRPTLSLPSQFDLHPSRSSQNLVAVIRVRDELDDGVIDIADRQFGVLYDAPGRNFQLSSFDGGHWAGTAPGYHVRRGKAEGQAMWVRRPPGSSVP